MTSDQLDQMFLGTADEQADHESLDTLIAELESEGPRRYDIDHPSVVAKAMQNDAQHEYESNQR